MEPNFKENILLFAEIIVPELHKKASLKYAFIKNFKQLFLGLEKDSASKIKLLVNVIAKLSIVYNFKPFKELSFENRKKYIDKLFHFPVGKLVGGLTGLRSLVLISYYGIEDVWPTINYEGPINAQLK